MGQPYFTGPFAILCEQFVAQKRAIGIAFSAGQKRLRQFDNFCKEHKIDNFIITEELVSAYCIRRPNESDNSRRDRIFVVRAFADFLTKQGYTAYVLPELPKRGESHKPYIFTKEEMNKIFTRLDEWAPSNFTTAHMMFSTLFRLLYGCGLRISEVLSLLKSDVDTEIGVIHIRNGKNGRERFTPMSKSLTEICIEFLDLAHKNTNDETPLFYNKNRTAYSRSTIDRQFRNVLWDVGIPYLGLNAGPRVHDIRHTFMCHNIRNWTEEGIPVCNKLPILSKYVGHSSVNATQWYLRLTAENYPHIREICERELSGMYDSILNFENYEEVSDE